MEKPQAKWEEKQIFKVKGGETNEFFYFNTDKFAIKRTFLKAREFYNSRFTKQHCFWQQSTHHFAIIFSAGD